MKPIQKFIFCLLNITVITDDDQLDPDHVGCRWLYDHRCTAKAGLMASGQLTDSLIHEFDKLFTEYRSPSKFFSFNYFRNVLRIRLLVPV